MFQFPLEGRKGIKVVVISQEPAARRARLVSPVDENAVEHHLRKECSGLVPRPIVKQIHEIIGGPFDPYDGPIYWTHALKCIPKADTDISKKDEWEKCSPLCVNNLRSELRSIDSPELVIIALGRYATGLALAVVNDQDEYLTSTPKIYAYIAQLGSEAARKSGGEVARFKVPYFWEGKKVFLTSFIHASNKNRPPNQPEVVAAQRTTEGEEIAFVRDYLTR